MPKDKTGPSGDDALIEKVEQHLVSNVKRTTWKWLCAIGVTGIVAAWGWGRNALDVYDTVPKLKADLEESQKDRQALHSETAGIATTLKSHESEQAVQLKEVTMTLKAIEKTQVEQNTQMRDIGRKLDQVIMRGRSAASPYDPADNDGT